MFGGRTTGTGLVQGLTTRKEIKAETGKICEFCVYIVAKNASASNEYRKASRKD